MARPAAVAIGVLAVAAVVGYGVIAHVLTVSDDRSMRGYGFALASLWVLAVASVWGSRWRGGASLLITLLVAGAWLLRDRVPWDPRWVYLVQHAGTNLWLGLLFGLTLRPGRVALITRLATLVHGSLPASVVGYTRRVTLVWTVYFAAMTLASLVLFIGGWAWWWSVLANFVTLPSVVLLFVAEYLVRRHAHPEFAHANFVESCRAIARKF